MDAIPSYVASPLRSYLDYLDESMRLLHMSMGGIAMITSIPHSLEVLGEGAYCSNPPEDPVKRKAEFLKELRQAQERARFAEKERDRGFPLLHAHTLVGVWGAFESALEDSIVGMLMNEPDLLQSEHFSKIKVSLADFLVLEKEDHVRYIVEEMSRSHSLVRRQGVDGFEIFLGFVGLSGAVDPAIKKTIWEVNHVRNVIVHRGSIADRKLVQSCPWLNYKVSDKITISHQALEKYVGTLTEYLNILIRRLCVKYDVDYEKKVQAVLRIEDSEGNSAARDSNGE